MKLTSLFLEIKKVGTILFQKFSFFHQFSKFTLVGILNAVVGYGIFFLLVSYVNYIFALIISHIIGVIHSYIWNRYWVFKSKKSAVVEFIKFESIYLISLILNIILLVILVQYFFISPRIAQLGVIILITFISYFGHRHWSFRNN